MVDNTVSGSAIIFEDIVTGSAIIFEDTVTGSSITLEDVNGSLSDMVSGLEEKFLYIQEQFDKRADFFVKVEEWKDQFFELFENFGNVSFDFLSIIGGILIALFLWFIIRLVYKFIRMFI